MEFKPIAHIAANSDLRDYPVRLAILGATGSIGRQTIDLVEAFPEMFRVSVLTVNRRVEDAARLCRRVRPAVLVIADITAYTQWSVRLKAEFPDMEVCAGVEAMTEAVQREDVDMVVTATVGYSGLLPTVAAIRAGKDIALANKETLVVAGDYIRKMLEGSKSRIFPVDSEHSAIVQCLVGEDPESVARLIITASGGPFRTWDIADIERATVKDALRHPNWNMGAKITVDSATMMNKSFEIIEAHYLFGLPERRIDAVVHPQSIVHSMVEFVDGAVKAQLGMPDMHLPIAYALGVNHRLKNASKCMKTANFATLTFEEPDIQKFPCLGFAHRVLEDRGNTACVINAANEVAVDAFLKGNIPFGHIYRIIDATLDRVGYIAGPSLEDYVETNAESRRIASEIITNI